MLGMGQAAGADIYLRRRWFGLLTQNRGGLIQTAEQQCAWTNLLLWACKQEDLLVLSSNPKFAFWALVDQNVIKHSDCGVFLENSIYFTVFIIWVGTYLTKYCESPFFDQSLFAPRSSFYTCWARGGSGGKWQDFQAGRSCRTTWANLNWPKQPQLPSPSSSAPAADSHSFLALTWTFAKLQGEAGQEAKLCENSPAKRSDQFWSTTCRF